MQRGRSFLILLVVAAALGGYYYFVEAGRDPMAEDARPLAFPGVEAGTIQELVVTAETGAVTRARKTDGDWTIVEPAGVEADLAALSSLASSLETLEIQTTLDEAPASMAPYGLEPPRYTLGFRTAEGGELRQLEVGDRTPTGGDMYARIAGEPALLLIAGYHDTSLNKTTFDLRDKAVLHLDRDVDRLQVTPPDGPVIEATRAENDWRLTAPVDARADFTTVDGLIRRVLQAEMKAIASETADDLGQFGLASPRATVTFGTGSAQATLALGSETDDGASIYARDTSRDLVFTLDAALLEEVSKEPADLRMKDVFMFRSFNAVGFSLTIDGRTYTFAKTTPEATEENASPAPVWTRTAPEAGDVEQGVLTGLLTSLSNLRADGFADRAQASGEELVVTARFGDIAAPSEETVTFRRSADVVHAIVPGEPGAAVIPTSDFDAAVATIRQLTGSQ